MAAKKKEFPRIYPRSWDQKVILKEFNKTNKIDVDNDGIQPKSQEEFDYYMKTKLFRVESERPMPQSAGAASSMLASERKEKQALQSEVEELRALLEEKTANKKAS